MSFGLRVWLGIWSFIVVFFLFNNLDTNTYKIFSYQQMTGNLFIFVPSASILFISIFFQIINSYLKKFVISVSLALISYFTYLTIFLPYSFRACILAGLIAMPIGLFHYRLSVTFFGDIEY